MQIQKQSNHCFKKPKAKNRKFSWHEGLLASRIATKVLRELNDKYYSNSNSSTVTTWVTLAFLRYRYLICDMYISSAISISIYLYLDMRSIYLYIDMRYRYLRNIYVVPYRYIDVSDMCSSYRYIDMYFRYI